MSSSGTPKDPRRLTIAARSFGVPQEDNPRDHAHEGAAGSRDDGDAAQQVGRVHAALVAAAAAEEVVDFAIDGEEAVVAAGAEEGVEAAAAVEAVGGGVAVEDVVAVV